MEHNYKADVGRIGNSFVVSLTFDNEFVAAVFVQDSSMIDEIVTSWETQRCINVEIIPIDDEEVI